MKIIFNKLQTSKETIQVSLDGGTTWNSYVVSEIIESGIPLDENQEYDKIHIKGSATVLKNLDVVKSIEIPEKVTVTDGIFTYDIENKIFGNNITSVKVPEVYTDIGMGAFTFLSNLTNIKLPESLTSIGEYAFQDCTGLTSIDLPESLTSIGYSAFQSCTGLTSIDLPEGVTSIGQYAFNGCSNLTSITLPESLTSIGERAFQNCTSLKTINFKGTEDQWNSIKKGAWWNSNCHSDMVINFDYQGE